MQELKGKYNKDCKIFTDNIENEAISQIYEILNHPFSEGNKIRIQPDVHAGSGICVGYTSTIDSGAVAPQHIGVDIGCQLTTIILDRKIPEEKYAEIEHKIRQAIPMGFDINDKRQFETKEFIKFLKSFYDRSKAGWNDMILDFDCSENGISKWLRKIGMDEGMFFKSLGSLGGGNHFCELGDTEKVSTFTIHCGSRNLGLKVCKYWENVASNPNKGKKAEFKEEIKKIKESCKDRKQIPALIEELKEKQKEEVKKANGYLTGDSLKGYLTDMVIATAYAHFNHLIISRKIKDILQKVCNAKAVEEIKTVHNYIDFQDRIIRKGSVRSYKGEKFVLPFNMRDGIAICEGKSNPDWNYSAPHGAGRIMSRSKAKSNIKLSDFKKQMEGIYSTSVCESTLDESPDAYKDYHEIIENIKDTCDILYFIKPVINLKAK